VALRPRLSTDLPFRFIYEAANSQAKIMPIYNILLIAVILSRCDNFIPYSKNKYDNYWYFSDKNC
jgi:hypothetical protein